MAGAGLLAEAEACWARYLCEAWRTGQWDQQPEEDRDYGQRHLGEHLDAADAPDAELYALVDRRWMQAWMALEHVPSGFLLDVDRAWRRADLAAPHAAADEGLTDLVMQWRCALCHASVVGISAKVSPELLEGALRTQVWGLGQALAVVKRVPRSWSKRELWAALARALPPTLQPALLSEVRSMAAAEDRVQALTACLPSLAPEGTTQACRDGFEAATALQDLRQRGEALREIVALAPEAAAGYALTLIESDAHGRGVRDFDRQPVLTRLATIAPPAALERVRRLVDALPLEDRRGALFVLATRAPEGERAALLDATLASVRVQRHLDLRCRNLAQLASWAVRGVGAAIEEALQAVEQAHGQDRLRAIEALGEPLWSGAWATRLARAAIAAAEPFWSVRAVVALFGGLQGPGGEEALAAIRAARPEERAPALATLAARSAEPLRGRLWAEALTAAGQALAGAATRRAAARGRHGDDYDSAHLLDPLVELAPPEHLSAVARLVRALQGRGLRAPKLAHLAARSAARSRGRLAAQALTALRGIEEPNRRAEVAAEVAKAGPEAQRSAAVAIGLEAIRDAQGSPFLHRLLPLLTPEDAVPALQAVRRLQQPAAVAGSLAPLAECLPAVLPGAVAVAREVSDPAERARALASLVRLLAPEAAAALAREAVAASEVVGDAGMVAGLRPQVLAATVAPAEVAGATELVPAPLALADAGPALQAVQAIEDPDAWLAALLDLLPRLPPTLRADPARNAWFYAQEAMGADRYGLVQTMAALLPHLPDSMRETALRHVRDGVAAIHDPRERAYAALEAARVSADDERTALLAPLLGLAAVLPHEDDVASLFSLAATLLPAKLLPVAAEAAFGIENDELLAREVGTLAARAARLAAGAPAEAHACWQRILHGYAQRPRPRLLGVLPALVPLAVALAPLDSPLADRLVIEAESVAQWWP